MQSQTLSGRNLPGHPNRYRGRLALGGQLPDRDVSLPSAPVFSHSGVAIDRDRTDYAGQTVVADPTPAPGESAQPIRKDDMRYDLTTFLKRGESTGTLLARSGRHAAIGDVPLPFAPLKSDHRTARGSR